RGVHLRLQLQPRRAGERAPAAAFPETAGEDPRQARREADRDADAADHAEGALRPGEHGALRAGVAELYAFHLADSPLSGSGGAPRAARLAPRPADRWNARGVG